ncbi:xanthine phosphoribosyltransferase [Periweissella beninensis]|uniref:xanthine phosphoribosyltransferase n=1 Tax=Periweissella beninensis TaxID=504936 RepID=UPI0021A84304|nr:xanthine phosphoribosyltransferase [Periweissella beninensis]MCT4396396.1 xanthine phosphoribosyltransferase [Periweissella beninensis]
MEALKQKILDEGRVLPGNVLKVDSFLNQQIDVKLMEAIGKEFALRFADDSIDKVLSIESSGIAPALMVAKELGVPMVFARKRKSLTISENVYSVDLFSYTTQKHTQVIVDQRFLTAGERILIIDDFLANGQAAEGLLKIISRAQAIPVGLGVLIEKSFQSGRQLLEKANVRTESLVRISSLVDGHVTFLDDGK